MLKFFSQKFFLLKLVKDLNSACLFLVCELSQLVANQLSELTHRKT